jgi:hypothetical protein
MTKEEFIDKYQLWVDPIILEIDLNSVIDSEIEARIPSEWELIDKIFGTEGVNYNYWFKKGRMLDFVHWLENKLT